MEKAFRLLLNTSCGLTFCFSRASHYVPANILAFWLTLAAGAVVVILRSTVLRRLEIGGNWPGRWRKWIGRTNPCTYNLKCHWLRSRRCQMKYGVNLMVWT